MLEYEIAGLIFNYGVDTVNMVLKSLTQEHVRLNKQ